MHRERSRKGADLQRQPVAAAQSAAGESQRTCELCWPGQRSQPNSLNRCGAVNLRLQSASLSTLHRHRMKTVRRNRKAAGLRLTKISG